MNGKREEICLFPESICFVFRAPAKHKMENTSVKSVKEITLSIQQLSFFPSSLYHKSQVNCVDVLCYDMHWHDG